MGTQMTQIVMKRYDFFLMKSYLIIIICVICVPILYYEY